MTPFSSKNLKSYSRQAAQPVISNSSLQDVKLYFPRFINEKQIVEKLDNILSESKKLEATYQQKRADLDELKKSILQKAFDGELWDQNRENDTIDNIFSRFCWQKSEKSIELNYDKNIKYIR